MAKNSWDDFRKEKQRQRQEEARSKVQAEPARQENPDLSEKEQEPPKAAGSFSKSDEGVQAGRGQQIRVIDLTRPPSQRRGSSGADTRASGSSASKSARSGSAARSSKSARPRQSVPTKAQIKAAEREEKEVRKALKAQEKKRKRTEKPKLTQRAKRRRRRLYTKMLLSLVVLTFVGYCVYFFVAKRTYHDYKVIKYSEQEDVVSTGYLPMNGKILRYSPDGVSLVDSSLVTQWSEVYDMSNPIADVRGDHAVIADRDGTAMVMVDPQGVTGSVKTSYAIVKACVSENGLVAAILDGGGDTWINFYGADGALIAENQTTMEDPGYPMDVSLSDNGVLMMVAYQFIDGSKTTSYVAFYNFGDVGQNADDRIVSGYTYEGRLVPQVRYLDASHSVAFRDDGLVTYHGNQIPEENRTVRVDKEIVSTFYDKDTIGLVFKNDSKEKMYTMQVYGINGDMKFSRDFNVPYSTIKMSNGYIIMYNSGQLCILSSDGTERYLGSADGTINDCSRLAFNKYILVLDNGVNIIRFT